MTDWEPAWLPISHYPEAPLGAASQQLAWKAASISPSSSLPSTSATLTPPTHNPLPGPLGSEPWNCSC